MIDESIIQKAVELLQQAAPGSTVIVFGSCTRGEVTEDSDHDQHAVDRKTSLAICGGPVYTSLGRG
jgi:predicted nucleotidyltransferase